MPTTPTELADARGPAQRAALAAEALAAEGRPVTARAVRERAGVMTIVAAAAARQWNARQAQLAEVPAVPDLVTARVEEIWRDAYRAACASFDLEPIQTPATPALPEAVARGVSATVPPAVRQPDLRPMAEPKTSRTFQVPKSLLAEAQTAVLRTSGYPGGYLSLNALVTTALDRELERLADEFNDGERFEPNEGTFRTGRPVGS